jgi:hypothetical protein
MEPRSDDGGIFPMFKDHPWVLLVVLVSISAAIQLVVRYLWRRRRR